MIRLLIIINSLLFYNLIHSESIFYGPDNKTFSKLNGHIYYIRSLDQKSGYRTEIVTVNEIHKFHQNVFPTIERLKFEHNLNLERDFIKLGKSNFFNKQFLFESNFYYRTLNKIFHYNYEPAEIDIKRAINLIDNKTGELVIKSRLNVIRPIEIPYRNASNIKSELNMNFNFIESTVDPYSMKLIKLMKKEFQTEEYLKLESLSNKKIFLIEPFESEGGKNLATKIHTYSGIEIVKLNIDETLKIIENCESIKGSNKYWIPIKKGYVNAIIFKDDAFGDFVLSKLKKSYPQTFIKSTKKSLNVKESLTKCSKLTINLTKVLPFVQFVVIFIDIFLRDEDPSPYSNLTNEEILALRWPDMGIDERRRYFENTDHPF